MRLKAYLTYGMLEDGKPMTAWQPIVTIVKLENYLPPGASPYRVAEIAWYYDAQGRIRQANTRDLVVIDDG